MSLSPTFPHFFIIWFSFFFLNNFLYFGCLPSPHHFKYFLSFLFLPTYSLSSSNGFLSYFIFVYSSDLKGFQSTIASALSYSSILLIQLHMTRVMLTIMLFEIHSNTYLKQQIIRSYIYIYTYSTVESGHTHTWTYTSIYILQKYQNLRVHIPMAIHILKDLYA